MARIRSRKRNKLVDLADALTSLGLKLGAAVSLLVLGYLVYGLVTKHGLARMSQLPEADRLRVVGNVALACKILGISGTVTAVCAAARYYVEETLGYIMSLLGVFLYLGMPWVFSLWFAPSDLRANEAIGLIVTRFQTLGGVLFVIGVLLILRETVVRISQALSRKEERRGAFMVGEFDLPAEEKFRPGLLGRCWQTPHCREFLRKLCPAFEARKSCWRLKAGCFCDEGTILRAMKSQGKASTMFARDLHYRTGSVQGERALTAAQKRARCRTCVIYLFHQDQKYRLISPLVFPAVVGLIWLFYSQIELAVRSAVNYTEKFMKVVSFLPQPLGSTSASTSVPDIVVVLFVVWLAIVAISYALQLVEFCVFKMQI